jgi:hypothetical protein
MQNNLNVHGEFPNEHVFKAFSDRGHAEAFIEEGRFQMGSLTKYRESEDDARRDPSEGHGHICVPGQVMTAHLDTNDSNSYYITEDHGLRDIHTRLDNPIYIFSTSLPEIDINTLKNKFGQFIVQIDFPRQLAHDITEHLKLRCERYAGGIEGSFVSYNQGGIAEKKLNNLERTSLSYSQKPNVFSDECEFRFIAIDMGSPSVQKTNECLKIDLGGPISYARIHR